MNPFAKRAEAHETLAGSEQPLELTHEHVHVDDGFDHERWSESQSEARGAGGRQVLGAALALLAAAWLAFTAWSAGGSLSAQSPSSADYAQWVAVAAGPLALLGLAWLIFGRTRRKEAERFTQSVVAMRSETRSLEALLQVLSQRIADSRTELTMITQHLMQLGDEATGKLGNITREFDSSSERLVRHGEALDRAAGSARTDIAVLLEDLPRAEATARAAAEQMRSVGSEAAARASEFREQVHQISERTQDADRVLGGASERLAARLAEIDSAASGAVARVGEAEAGFSGALDALLDRTSATLDEIRSGIDVQAAAVTALVAQASAGIGRAETEAAEAVAANVGQANSAMETLAGRVAEQQSQSQRMVAEIDRGLAMIDQRFTELASNGDERANHFLDSLTRARTELDALASDASSQDDAIGALAERTGAIRETMERLAAEIRDNVGTALGEAQGGADRLAAAAGAARPEIGWMRDAAVEASDRLAATSEWSRSSRTASRRFSPASITGSQTRPTSWPR
jgi:hypothetical protein